MPIENLEDFKKQYYRIINEIAFTPQAEREAKKAKWQQQLTTLQEEAQTNNVEVQGFELNYDSLQGAGTSHLKELSDFYKNIHEGQDVTQGLRDINQPDIPDTNKQEIKAQGFVLAFDEMKKNAANQEQFLKHYANVQRMSHGGIPLQVETPELQKELGYANNITQVFTEKYVPEQGDVGKLFTEIIEQQRQVAEEQKTPILKVDENYNNQELTQSNYWYTDKDINAVLSQRLKALNDQNVYQMDAVALYSGTNAEQNNKTVTDRIKTRINEMGEPKEEKKLLIPVNVGGNHWIGAAVEFELDGKAKVTYTDSLEGDGLSAKKEALDKLMGDAIGQDIGNVSTIHDNPQKQPKGNEWDCGPLTVENLIRITAPGQEIKQDIRGAQNIRQQQAQLFSDPAQAQGQVKGKAKQKEQGRAVQVTLDQVKEKIAHEILQVAGVKDEGQRFVIMNDPEAKAAIMKRAKVALDEMEVKDVTSFQKVKEEDLQKAIGKQSKEFIAQVGRIASWSIDSWDVRGKEGLHEKYTEKANKMKPADFDKNATKALEYETSKDKRGLGKSFLYNLFYRKPLQFINWLRPKDKPLLSPGQKALVGLVALAVLAPPFGAIAAAFMFFSAAKDGLYEGSKLQEWVNKKWFKPPPEKLESKELEKITAKGLIEDIQKVQEKLQEKAKEEVEQKNVVQQQKKKMNPEIQKEVDKIIQASKEKK